MGGIAGDCAKGRFLFDSCINYGDLLASNVSDFNTIVGGIVSSVTTPIKQPVTIINCANLGDANGYYVGGFIGAITHSGNYATTRWYINSSIQKGEFDIEDLFVDFNKENKTINKQEEKCLTNL